MQTSAHERLSPPLTHEAVAERINKLEELLTTQLIRLVSELRGDPYDVRYAHNPVRSPLFSPAATMSASLAYDTGRAGGYREKISPSPSRLMNPSPVRVSDGGSLPAR